MRNKAKAALDILRIASKNYLHYVVILITVGVVVGGIVIGMIYMVGKTGATVKVGNAEISAPAHK